jgi:hypothetical protein
MRIRNAVPELAIQTRMNASAIQSKNVDRMAQSEALPNVARGLPLVSVCRGKIRAANNVALVAVSIQAVQAICATPILNACPMFAIALDNAANKTDAGYPPSFGHDLLVIASL